MLFALSENDAEDFFDGVTDVLDCAYLEKMINGYYVKTS